MHSDFEILNLWTQGEGQLNQGINVRCIGGGGNIFWGGVALARLLYSIP
jgi:hypothetical protein